MASTNSETPASVTTSTNTTTQRKTRLNPARRKAAKAKINIPNLPSGPVNPATNVATKPRTPPTKTDVRSTQETRPKLQSPKPTVLPRQNTEPVTNLRKPTLQRTITAPETTTANKATSIGIKAPALVTGGLVGCAAGAAILLGVGMWYDFSGVESAIMTARAAKLCVDNLTEELITSLKTGTYSGDEALDMLRRTTLAYASTIPEGAPFVERIFREIEMVRKQRGREVDKVVAETYSELAEAGAKGASEKEMRGIVVRQLLKLSRFAGQATQDVVARNPKLRPLRDNAVNNLQPLERAKTPTIKVNMAVKQR